MIAPTGPFSRAERIRRSSEFRAVSRQGRRRASRHFVVLTAPMRAPGEVRARLGLTVSRRVGNAVARNRVKRRVREWFRRGGREASAGLDVVVIARPGAAELAAGATAMEIARLFEPSR